MQKLQLSQIGCQHGRISELILNSFESSVYLAEVLIEGERWHVCDEQGRPLVFRSQLEAKKPFKGLGIGVTRLIQHSSYNEMIGMPGGKVDPLEVRLANPDEDLS